MLGEQPARVCQPHAATSLLQKAEPGLLFQDGELLGDRGRRVVQRGRDRAERAALLELAEHPKPAKIKVDHAKKLTN